LGVSIVGVSFDSPEENEAWAVDEGFEFELWSDLDRTLALYYGAAASESASLASRRTFLLDAEGTLVLEYRIEVLGTHPAEVLSDCELLFGSGG
jgi:peroxiredoxin Q/BCP